MAVIGFIGLGNMGSGMAANLAKAGHEVRGFDLSADAVAALTAKGGKAAASVAEAVTGADAVVTMLPAGKHVRGVYEGEEGILSLVRPDVILMDCSTIDVDSARAVAALAAEKGLAFVDAPVSGGVAAAEGGTLTFMVGGPEAAFEAARPYLDKMGKAVIRAGEAGAGQAAKICNNMLLAIHMIGTCEAFVLAEKLGLSHQALFDVASTSSGQCWSLTSYCPVPGPVPTSPANRGYRPGFTAAMMAKDLRLAQEAALDADVATPMGAQARSLYALFAQGGHGGLDFSGIYKMIDGDG
jgi:3-hydroxyisobutyrate dehydrogenase